MAPFFFGMCCWNFLGELELLRVLVNEFKPIKIVSAGT